MLHSAASDLGRHYLHRPACPSSEVYYDMIREFRFHDIRMGVEVMMFLLVLILNGKKSLFGMTHSKGLGSTFKC